ncbi:type II-B CRISPR-associated RNA-guided endonuclease Cas9/Csx12 [Desulfoplanes sp. PS50]
MGKTQQFISPIAVDLGAKHTGVYAAFYKAHSRPENIERHGVVYNLDQQGYTLLMTDRTAKRHQRRGYDRRQMAKRLFRLIWEKKFGLPWNKDTAQVVGFLLNRRGFSYLSGAYSQEILAAFPEDAWNELPKAFQQEAGGCYPPDLNARLQDWAKSPSKLDQILNNLIEFKEKQEKITQSPWIFKKKEFDLENAKFDTINDNLHHLVFALQSVNSELASGAVHRKKYFEQVSDVLTKTDHTHTYLKIFCTTLQSGGFDKLTPDNLTRLIGHISNLELKPLRKYFNDTKHRDGDYWDEERLTKLFDRWLCKEWRVDYSKNPEKARDGKQDYTALRIRWKNHRKSQKGIIEFWLEQNPAQTLPPYQSQNNRRPPRCQSLVLNPAFLDVHYPEWQTWTAILENLHKEYLGDLRTAFKKLTSSKGNRYFDQTVTGELKTDSQKRTSAHLDARMLQFILDIRRDYDPACLNKIYSHAKKLRQQCKDRHDNETIVALQNTLNKSKLPDMLKNEPDFDDEGIFPDGSFLHMICHYYKLRQRARDGRIFIHPEYNKTKLRGFENSRRFDDKDQMLTFCNLKTRQKKYQSLHDLAGIFQISPKVLRDTIQSDEDDQIIAWLKTFRGLQTLCKDAATKQKNHRGQLNLLLQTGKNNDLNKLKERATAMSQKIAQELFSGNFEEKAKKFATVFSFVQLHNIAFTERSGNARSCPICSMDNSRRMESTEDILKGAKAQRLPAIPTRIIDGAVKKMTRILSKRITQDRWPAIESALKSGDQVRVPIVTESNRFEFEPKLKELKTGKVVKNTQTENFLEDKKTRIKNACGQLCPYTGETITNGEIDHIIPRTSQYGTLNDEANLIYASKNGNERKGEKTYGLDNLSKGYKKQHFATDDDTEITNMIEKTIWDKENKRFKFGNYLSFINLQPDEQKAFRHALFLDSSSEIRQAVIKAVTNRTRSFVNGTQRYFAQALADELHKKALARGWQDRIDFDFFAVEAVSSSKGNGIRDYRYIYEQDHTNFAEFIKKYGEPQKPYSHILDAQFAFMIALEKHQKQGSFLLDIPEDRTFLPVPKGQSGHKSPQVIFYDIYVAPEKMDTPVDLERRKPHDGFIEHRSFTRDSFYADRYLPVLIKKTGHDQVEFRAGFDWENSAQWPLFKKRNKKIIKDEKALNNLKEMLPLCNQVAHYPKNYMSVFDLQRPDLGLYELLFRSDFFQTQEKQRGYIYLTIDRKALHNYWIENFNTKEGKPFDEFFTFCFAELGYKTEKKKITPELLTSKWESEIESKLFVKFKNKPIELPYLQHWKKLQNLWKEKKQSKNNKFDKMLYDFFLKNKTHISHQRARKTFSLPVTTSEGKFILRRKGWNGVTTHHLINDSDSTSVNNKPISLIFNEQGEFAYTLADWAKSRNLVKLSKEQYTEGRPVSPYSWWKINVEEFVMPDGIAQIWLRIDDKTAPSVAIKIDRDAVEINPDVLTEELCRHGFRPRKAKKGKNGQPDRPALSADEVMREFWKDNYLNLLQGEIIQYKGSKGYTKLRKRALKTAIEVDKPE